jgi:hypothetical protein
MAKKSDLKKLFKGKETKSEELKEAKAIKSGKITPEEYASGEKSEGVHKMKDGGSCYKEGGSVKKAPSASKPKASPYAPASQKAALQKAVQAKAPKASDADRVASRVASVEKVKGMKAQMAARNTPVPKASDADRGARQAAMMQKVQAMKAKQQAMPARPAKPAAPSPQPRPAKPAAPSPQPRPAKAIGGSAGMAAAPMNKMKAGGVTGSSIDGIAKRGKTKCMKNGGFVRAADGCTSKGKTKGRFV